MGNDSNSMAILVQAKLDQSAQAIKELESQIQELSTKVKQNIEVKLKLSDSGLDKAQKQIEATNEGQIKLFKSLQKRFKEEEKQRLNQEKYAKKAQQDAEKQLQYDQKTRINIQKQQDQELRLNQIIEQRIANFQKELSLRSQALTGKYGSLVDVKQLEKVNEEAQKLTVQTFSPEAKTRINNMFKEVEVGAKNSSSALKLAQQDARSFGDEMLRAGLKFAQWMVIGTLIMQPIRALRDGVRIIREIDTALTQLRKVSGETLETMRGFAIEANNIAKNLGATTQEVINSATEFARLGYNIKQASKLAEESILFSTVGNINVEKASKTLISTVKAFGIEVDTQGRNVRRVIDVINEVGNNFAISQEDISEVLQRSSASMKAAGNTLEETIALATASQEIVQDAGVVGTALKTMSMRRNKCVLI